MGVAADARLDADPQALIRGLERALTPPRPSASPQPQPAA
jgi:hypothetical protein